MNSDNSNSKNHKPQNSLNSTGINICINKGPANSNPDNFINKKKNKRNKNKRYIEQQINEEYDNYFESQTPIKSSDNLLINTLLYDNLNSENISMEKTKSSGDFEKIKHSNPNKNFYKNNNSKSLNNLKIKELKDSIRKNSSHNIIGDIFLELKSNDNQSKNIV
jgi:hypothetical protein